MLLWAWPGYTFGYTDLFTPVALGQHDHAATGWLELVDVRIHATRCCRAKRTARVALWKTESQNYQSCSSQTKAKLSRLYKKISREYGLFDKIIHYSTGPGSFTTSITPLPLCKEQEKTHFSTHSGFYTHKKWFLLGADHSIHRGRGLWFFFLSANYFFHFRDQTINLFLLWIWTRYLSPLGHETNISPPPPPILNSQGQKQSRGTIAFKLRTPTVSQRHASVMKIKFLVQWLLLIFQ